MLRLLLLLSILSVKLVYSTDFCNRKLCKIQIEPRVFQNLPHIGCNHNGQYSKKCPADAKILPMSTKRKNLILRLHNRLRNKVALGNLPGYPKAVRMPILRWDDELAYLAELNVKQCESKHDQCHNTDKFLYAGQNLGYMGAGNPRLNAERIKVLVQAWFEEYKVANASFINQYRRHPSGKPIGHFTTMIQDRTDSIGCAILRHTKNSHFFLACNYSFTNMVKDKVYTKGQKSCSKCRTGCNAVYKGLCNSHEYVNPDPDEDLD